MSDIWRYETKIVVKDSSVSNLLNEIHLNPLMFRPLFTPRTVNNLYFDTLDLDCFHDHIYGYPQRAKVRLRWYGDFEKITNPVLEIKKKEGTVGTKLSFPVSYDIHLDKNISLIDIMKHTTAPAQLQESLSHLVPSLYNRYYRSYFISANERVRLTLDERILHKAVHSIIWNEEPDDLKIVEFKYNQNEFFDGERALKNFSYVQDKSSKYIRGLLRVT
tara:strand:+ start:48075 stop:48728 length:654 start_codon:yes stop_codon:yes gene_type:complete